MGLERMTFSYITHPNIDTEIKLNLALLDENRFNTYKLMNPIDNIDKELMDRLQIKHGIVILNRRKE